MASAVSPLGSLSMARGCARIDAGPDTAKNRLSQSHSRSITPGYLQLLGYEKRFHTACLGSGHRQHRCQVRKVPKKADIERHVSAH